MDQKLFNKITDSNIELKMEYLSYVLEPIIIRLFEKQKEIERVENEQQPQKLLTIEDIAKKFKVTKATVHNWKNKGSIVGQKFGKNRYFTEDEVRKSMAKFGYTRQWDNRIND